MNSQYENLNDEYSAKPAKYYEASRSEMLSFVPQESSTVLEVGCGSGGFGKLIKERRPETVVWGIEPGEESARAAASKLDRVLTGTFSPAMPELTGRTFDAICLNDVLEHLVNPEQTLRELKPFLSPNGVVVASIPNILHFYQIAKIVLEQDWKYEESGIMDNTHLRFFTRKSIVRMFQTCNYEVVRIDGINPSFGLKYRVANTLMFGRLNDWRYEQFGVQARSKS